VIATTRTKFVIAPGKPIAIAMANAPTIAAADITNNTKATSTKVDITKVTIKAADALTKAIRVTKVDALTSTRTKVN